jgi:hypothetical protein
VRNSACAALIAAVVLSGCSFTDVHQTVHQTVPAAGIRTLHVSNPVGGITIRGWDKPLIDITADKSGHSSSDLDNITVKVSSQGSNGTIATVNNVGGGFMHGGIGYTIMVPAGVALDLDNSTGGLRVYGVNGNILARVGTGGIEGDLGRVAGARVIDMQVGTGGIDLKMARQSDATLDMSANVGGVDSDFKGNRVGTGSAKVRLHAGVGGVELHAR